MSTTGAETSAHTLALRLATWQPRRNSAAWQTEGRANAPRTRCILPTTTRPWRVLTLSCQLSTVVVAEERYRGRGVSALLAPDTTADMQAATHSWSTLLLSRASTHERAPCTRLRAERRMLPLDTAPRSRPTELVPPVRYCYLVRQNSRLLDRTAGCSTGGTLHEPCSSCA